MEMSMIAKEDIESGQDLTPPLPPLASSTASSSSPDLTVALRLLCSLPYAPSPPFHRLFGLLTNHQKLASDSQVTALLSETRINGNGSGDGDGDGDGEGNEEELVEALICLVLTNAVQVVDDGGRNVGIAVYGPHFSWINHSCSPNASYQFVIDKADMTPLDDTKMRILPLCTNGESGAFGVVDSAKGCNYGPKVIVRSISRIKKGEEITVAYTDLLQPKDIRQSELWSKYRFVCSCTRCRGSSCYVDHVLQEISVSNSELSSVVSVVGLSREEVSDKLAEYVDEIITEYLSDGDPKHCFNKLESLLMHGVSGEQLENSTGNSKLNFRLHPLHHLALNAYTTLASAYKVHANELLVLYPESEVGHHTEALDMARNSSAYSLFLAVATYHLYCFEPSLIASVTNFWISAGDSLLALLRNSSQCSSGKWKLAVSHLSSFNCSCVDKYEIFSSVNEVHSKDFESNSIELHYCITSFSQKVWRFLIQHCCYLKMFKDLNFSALGKSSAIWDLVPSLIGNPIDSNYTNDNVNLEMKEYQDELWMSIFRLGLHCLIFGGILARVCFGRNSHLISHVQRTLAAL